MQGQPRAVCLQRPTQQAQLGEKTLVVADPGVNKDRSAKLN